MNILGAITSFIFTSLFFLDHLISFVWMFTLLFIFAQMINKPSKVSETMLHHSKMQPAPAICFPALLVQLARQPFLH